MSKLIYVLASFFLIAILIQCDPTKKNDGFEKPLVLENATVINGTGTAPLENGVILIEGNKIREIGKAGDIKIPKTAEIIDCKGKYIIPGMIDLHMHFWESGRPTAQPTWIIDTRKLVPYDEEVRFMKQQVPATLKSYLCSGVTSVVALGALKWEHEVRDYADTFAFAPRVFLAGGCIVNYSTKNEWPVFDGEQTGMWIDNVADAGKMIQRLDSTRVDLIKILYEPFKNHTLPEFIPKMTALINESHKRKLRVSTHSFELRGAIEAMKAGTDVLAHTVTDSVINDEFISLAKKNNTVLTTSLSLFSNMNYLNTGYPVSYLDSCCADPLVLKSWRDWISMPADQKPVVPEWISKHEAVNKILMHNIRKAYESGLLICVGSDAGNVGCVHGVSFHQELYFLEKAGLKSMDILVAATRNGAIALGKQDELGTLEKGKLADLLVLDADPLKNIVNYSKINIVIKNGKVIERKLMEAGK